MKSFVNSFFVTVIVLSLSSCYGTHVGVGTNVNNNTTMVVLKSNNYKVIQKVSGTASGVTFMGVGGAFQALVENARGDMLRTAGLIGSSRAVINETVETNLKYYLGFVHVKTVTVSGYVIEFTGE
jgi:hypothetical protein